MYNKIILVGNLTRDIELRYTGNGTALAKTAIATSRKFNSNGERKEEVCFVDITFFGRSGEVANQYLRKGSKILVEGRLMFEQWTDQQGQKRSKHSVTVETMQMLDSKADAQNMDNGGFNNAPSAAPQMPQNDGMNNGDMAPSFGGTQSYQQQQAPQTPAPQNAFGQGGQPATGGFGGQAQAAPAQGQGFGGQQPNSAPQQQPAQSYQPQQLPEYDIDEDEIPF